MAEFDTSEVRKNLKKFRKDLRKATASATYQEGETRVTGAKLRTPVEDGHLRASGHVKPPEWKGDEVTVLVGFGGPSAPYAIYVHEILRYRHTTGEAKFLEREMMENASGMLSRIEAGIARELG